MQIKMLFTVLFSMVYLLLCPQYSMAWGIVHDPINYAVLIKNVQQLYQQYQLLQTQLNQLKQIQSAATGHYGFGQLLNSPDDLIKKQWTPARWQDALQGMAGGNPERYKELVQAYEKNHRTLTQSQFSQGATSQQTTRYIHDRQVNRVVAVNSTYAFNNIKSHLNTIHALSSKIDAASNTKAAMDLNSRLLTEMAYIQTQTLKMQVLLNQQLARTSADGIADESMRSQFNRLPEHK